MSYHEENETISVLRQQNRAQRSINKRLLRLLKTGQTQSDRLFEELCTGSESAQALEEIRTRGGIDCDPSDYNRIIETVLEALEFSNKSNTIDQESEHRDDWAV